LSFQTLEDHVVLTGCDPDPFIKRSERSVLSGSRPLEPETHPGRSSTVRAWRENLSDIRARLKHVWFDKVKRNLAEGDEKKTSHDEVYLQRTSRYATQSTRRILG
jgi:hypothetical protein